MASAPYLSAPVFGSASDEEPHFVNYKDSATAGPWSSLPTNIAPGSGAPPSFGRTSSPDSRRPDSVFQSPVFGLGSSPADTMPLRSASVPETQEPFVSPSDHGEAARAESEEEKSARIREKISASFEQHPSMDSTLKKTIITALTNMADFQLSSRRPAKAYTRRQGEEDTDQKKVVEKYIDDMSEYIRENENHFKGMSSDRLVSSIAPRGVFAPISVHGPDVLSSDQEAGDALAYVASVMDKRLSEASTRPPFDKMSSESKGNLIAIAAFLYIRSGPLYPVEAYPEPQPIARDGKGLDHLIALFGSSFKPADVLQTGAGHLTFLSRRPDLAKCDTAMKTHCRAMATNSAAVVTYLFGPEFQSVIDNVWQVGNQTSLLIALKGSKIMCSPWLLVLQARLSQLSRNTGATLRMFPLLSSMSCLRNYSGKISEFVDTVVYCLKKNPLMLHPRFLLDATMRSKISLSEHAAISFCAITLDIAVNESGDVRKWAGRAKLRDQSAVPMEDMVFGCNAIFALYKTSIRTKSPFNFDKRAFDKYREYAATIVDASPTQGANIVEELESSLQDDSFILDTMTQEQVNECVARLIAAGTESSIEYGDKEKKADNDVSSKAA